MNHKMKHTKNKFSFAKPFSISFCALLFASLFLFGCGTKKDIQKSGFYFDTAISIRLYDEKYASQLEECFSIADNYQKLFDANDADSDIAHINAANGEWVTVSDDTVTLLNTALHYSELSGGSFDITIGSVSALWDFSGKNPTVPTDGQLKEACSHVDYHFIEIEGNRVRLTDPKTQLDLGGIAKGFIADKMKAYLQSEGITEGIINLGGNVLTVGPKEDGSDYHIGIQKPFAEDGTAIATLSVTDSSVVSSGVYQRYFYEGDTFYHHLLNPKTGYPFDNGLYGVTILSESSVDGDCLSTACFALGLEDGLSLVESLSGVEAMFITSDMELIYSSGFPKQ